METKARHVLIGSVALAVLLAGAGFGLWIANVELGKSTALYDVYFEEPVSGVQVGGEVRFNGIRLGQVARLRLDEDNPDRVHATLALGEEAPIQEGAVARVMPKGITGVSFIQIESAPEPGPPLEAGPGEPHPVIPSEASPVQQLLGGVPDLLTKATTLIERLSDLVDDETRRSLSRSIADAEATTAALREAIERLVPRLEAGARDVSGAARSVERMSDRADAWLSGELPRLTQQAEGSLRDLGSFTRRLDTNLNARLAPQIHATLVELEAVARATRRIVGELRPEGRELQIGRVLPEAADR